MPSEECVENTGENEHQMSGCRLEQFARERGGENVNTTLSGFSGEATESLYVGKFFDVVEPRIDLLSESSRQKNGISRMNSSFCFPQLFDGIEIKVR